MAIRTEHCRYCNQSLLPSQVEDHEKHCKKAPKKSKKAEALTSETEQKS